MWLSDFSVKHPVVAIVLSLLLVVFGLITLNRLALREYPDVDPPVVSVETGYPGAAAQTVENRVTKVIEKRISGIEGIRTIDATSVDGLSKINIEFSLNRNIDAAANDVRERVSRVVDDLPDEADPPEIFKVDSNNNVIIWLNMASTKLNSLQLTDYAERYLVDKLSILKGVARVRIGGAKRYAMRVWLNRQAMAAKKVTVTDVENALRQNNIELPGGRIESSQRELSVWIKRQYVTPADFSKLVIRRESNGHLLRLGEVARVERGPENRRTELRGNGINMIGLGIIKQSRANSLEVSTAVKKAVAKIQPTLPKGTRIIESYDTSVFIRAAIHEVYKTFGIALVLVILVIFLFLGNVRSVFIPAVTVPISLIASFNVLYVLGYSLNLLTLLAMVLAIGLVVDDAIVVLENIMRRIGLGEKPLLASYRGTRQVGFAVIATTLVLLAVFLPITLFTGNVGRFFTEFAITIAAAVSFSSLIALTLTPVMCASILRGNTKGWLTRRTEKTMAILNHVYQRALTFCLQQRTLMVMAFLLVAALSVFLYRMIPEELVPQEDQGAFFVLVTGPEGASFSYMQKYMRKIEKIMMQHVKSGDATRALSIMPRGFGRSDPVNSGIGIVVMKHWKNRDKSTQQAVRDTMMKLVHLPGVQAFPVMRQGIGRGATQKVQFVIGNSNYDQLLKWRNIILREARKNKKLVNLDSDYKPTKPQLVVAINRDRAAELGVTVQDIGKTLEVMLGARDITTYIDKDEEYDVILEMDLKQKATRKGLNNIYVRSKTTSKLIPLSNLVTVKETTAPNALYRFNRMKTITITASLARGYTLGQALHFLENVVKQYTPEAHIDYKGVSRDYKEASKDVYFTLALALLVMFLVLAAQFGSFISPLIVLVTAPLAMTGALLGLFFTDNTLNIYSQIGIIMLIGLAAKNGILIVEFINQMREAGEQFVDAIIKGATIRLRPVLMTAISTIFGAIPLILATEPGAQSRIAIGVVIFFGVTFATFLTLFVIPVFYEIFAKNTRTKNSRAREVEVLESDS